MTHRFAFTPHAGQTLIRLVGPAGPVHPDRWALDAPAPLRAGVDLARRLEAETDAATFLDDTLIIDDRVVAGLDEAEAEALGLVPPFEGGVEISQDGSLGGPTFRASLRWTRPGGQPVAAPAPEGAWLRVGGAPRRLRGPLFDIAEAARQIERAPGRDARMKAVGALGEALPAGAAQGVAAASGAIARISVILADSFSLDAREENGDLTLRPVLHDRRKPGEAEPLLTQAQQAAFAERQFADFSEVRGSYALGGDAYVALTPELRAALGAVHNAARGTREQRRAMMRNPGAAVREAAPDLGDEALGAVIVETAAWAARVIGLGEWRPRVLPWISLPRTQWFGPGEPPEDGAPPMAVPALARGGLTIGDISLELDRVEVESLRDEIAQAIAAGRNAVLWRVGDAHVAVPPSPETLAALDGLAAGFDSRQRPPQAPSTPGPTTPSSEALAPAPSLVLLIHAHLDDVVVEGVFTPRPALPPGAPRRLASRLKAHQVAGLDWLQRNWSAGRPGALLADDMGLGKTLQALSLLAWLREGMAARAIPQRPLLIVAPTGLLANWRAEHDRHLAAPGLGDCLPAFGKGLAALRRTTADGRPGLDVARLQEADWVLTTFETLRDYDRDFGAVDFAALVFDEAQKIKTPGIRLTDAAKAMRADFRLAMTGTPIENRLADLWCITDAVQPGMLFSLKDFSARFEARRDPHDLRRLKRSLEQETPHAPAFMLRRMARGSLEGLPELHENRIARAMPPAQAASYDAALAEARTNRAPGAALKALQRIAAISLHPDPTQDDDTALMAGSSRLAACVEVLDRVRAAGEAALIFLDRLGFQARLAALLQRRYGLPAPPRLVNGEVDGATRQKHVDAFQRAPGGFEVMILSPRAGGVGLTLTRANHVILLSRWWNPAVEDQCVGRSLRIGQELPVTVHVPIALHPSGRRSFDENLDALLQRKRGLTHEVLAPPGDDRDAQDELFRATVL